VLSATVILMKVSEVFIFFFRIFSLFYSRASKT